MTWTSRGAAANRIETPIPGVTRRVRAVWTGLVVFLGLAAAVTGYLLLSMPGGPLPRPAVMDRLSLVAVFDRFGTLVAGTIGAAAAVALAGILIWMRRSVEAGCAILRQSFESDPRARALSGADGAILCCSAAFPRLLALDPERLTINAIGEVPEVRDRFAVLRGKLAAGRPGEIDLRILADAGGVRWVHLSAHPLEHFPGCVLWSADDVTDRRRLEGLLAEAHAKLRVFLDAPSAGFYTVDGEGRFVDTNGTLRQWLGLDPDDPRGADPCLSHVVAKADPDRPWTAFSEGFREPQGEVTLLRADGSEFQAEVVEAISGSTEDGTLRAHAAVRDLTAIRRSRDTVRNLEQRIRKLFEDAPVGIAMLDLDGGIVTANRSFQDLMGEVPAVPGTPVTELVAPAMREALRARLGQVVEGRGRVAPLHVALAGGADATASLYVNRMDDGSGRLSGLILHCFDTTQHRRLEAQFAQSQKMQAVGQLAGGVAHDFNNLLTVIIGFCDLILQRHRPGEQTFADIMQVKQNANRAANLVRQLLAFSRQQTLQPKVINITDVLADLSNLLRRLIGVGITLNMMHGRDLGLVKVDQVQLEQVIINLVVNARDAMKENGGTLTIRTSNVDMARPLRRGADVMSPGSYVRIDVSDTGIGIPEQNLERIFEPFFSTKEVGSGTGLGLSTVYGIVTQTGGLVLVDSTVGAGTTFSIYLPRYQEEPAGASTVLAEAPRLAARDLSGAGTVLLVEDEDPVRLFGARALRNKGYKVLEAKDGDAALSVIRAATEPIDLVISDVVMPEIDGPSLIREVHQRYPGMKVIFMSGYAEETFQDALQNEPHVHFLPKPFSLDQLAGKVKEVLAKD